MNPGGGAREDGGSDSESHRELLLALRRLCEATEIQSSEAFDFAGEHYSVPTWSAPVGTGLVACLAEVLYHRGYCRRFDPNQPPAGPLSPTRRHADALLLERLFGALAQLPAPADTGWRITAFDDRGHVVVTKNGHVRVFTPNSIYGPHQLGAKVCLWLSRASLERADGFFFVHPLATEVAWNPSAVVRIYWNLRAEVVEPFLRTVVTLDRYRIPYRAKTLASMERSRSDNTVIYCQRKHFPLITRLLLDQLTDSADGAHEIPLFTRYLAPGLAFAEEPDPTLGPSFGLGRCRVLAEALWNAHRQGLSGTSDACMDEVLRHFAARGLDLEQAHLGPLSADLDPLPAFEVGP